MKSDPKFLSILFVAVILVFAFKTAQAQEPNYAFVTFETKVTRQGFETSDKNPEERRIYVSNIVDFFPSGENQMFRNASKIADEYFTAAVVEPLKAKGILHQYYDDAIQINGNVVYRLDTRADVEEVREKVLASLKEQNINVFTFTWTQDGKDGLATSQPQLVVHNPEQPLYGVNDVKTNVQPKPVEQPKPSVKVKTPGKKKNH